MSELKLRPKKALMSEINFGAPLEARKQGQESFDTLNRLVEGPQFEASPFGKIAFRSGLVGDLEGEAVFAQLFPLFAPGVVQGAFSVIGSRFRAGEFDDVDSAEIANLVSFGFQPNILDAGNFRGHVLDSGDDLLLIVQGSGVLEFVRDNMHDSFGLAKFIDGGSTLRGE